MTKCQSCSVQIRLEPLETNYAKVRSDMCHACLHAHTADAHVRAPRGDARMHHMHMHVHTWAHASPWITHTHTRAHTHTHAHMHTCTHARAQTHTHTHTHAHTNADTHMRARTGMRHVHTCKLSRHARMIEGANEAVVGQPCLLTPERCLDTMVSAPAAVPLLTPERCLDTMASAPAVGPRISARCWAAAFVHRLITVCTHLVELSMGCLQLKNKP